MDTEKKSWLYHRWLLLGHRLEEMNNHIAIKKSLIDKWWQILDAHYSEPHRFHHGWDHIYEGLIEFDEVAHLFASPALAELAWFFHDAVYQLANEPGQSNEFLSVKLNISFCQECRLKSVPMSLIWSTKHDEKRLDKLTPDEQLICSIDLAILGQPPLRYLAYAHGIRQEYKSVPLAVYRTERAKIMEQFLQRDQLFPAVYFADKYEAQARDNLAAEIKLLQSGEFPEN